MAHLSSRVSAESIASRLKEERLRLGLTQPDVAGLCDASKRAVIEWEKQTPIPSDRLAILESAGFDTHYVLTGERLRSSVNREGEKTAVVLDEAHHTKAGDEVPAVREAGVSIGMTATPKREYNWRAAGPPLVWAADKTKSQAEKLAEEGFALVPRYNVQGSMGGGAVLHSEQVVDHLAFRTEWVRSELRANPANLVLISAVGDSMLPTLSSGDLLLVDKSEYKIRDDAIYVISVNGSLLVKRVQLLLDGTVIIRSDNPAYQPQTVKQPDIEDLKVVGRVVWVGRRV